MLATVALVGSVSALAPSGGALRAQDSGIPTVRGLAFKGNHALGDLTLASAIATTNSSWFATGFLRFLGLGDTRRFSEREFQRDVQRLILLYRRSGYLDATVDTTVRRRGSDIAITFHIREGKPVLVRSLLVRGLDSFPDRGKLLRRLPLKVGDPFNRDSLVATADTLAGRLQDRGFPAASVFLAPWTMDREARTADLVLDVAPGQPAVVGDIRVEGMQAVDSGVVVNLLTFQAGQRYRRSSLTTTERNLYRSELFRFASAELDTSRYHEGDPVVPMLVQVSEGPFHSVRSSIGFGSDDCFRGSLGWTARNVTGGGRVFDLTGQLSKIGVGTPVGFGAEDSFLCSRLAGDSVGSRQANYVLNLSLRQPAFGSPVNTLTLSAFAERRSEFKVYLRNEVGASARVTRETGARVPISLTYRVAFGRTEATAANFCAFFNACTVDDIRELRQRRILALLTGSVIRDRTDDPLDPTRGSILSGEVTVSSPLLGSESLQTFTRVIGEASWYRTVSRGVILAVRARGGVIFAPEVSLTSGRTNFIPPDQRFYAGGANDVRGFNQNQLGPVAYVVNASAIPADSTQPIPPDSVQVAATGGNTLVVGNVELRFPSPVFRNRLRLALFSDVGGVWERGRGAAAPVRIRMTPGAGLRIGTPLGPARLDVAYNPTALPPGPLFAVEANGDLVLAREGFSSGKRSSRYTLHFSVGHAF